MADFLIDNEATPSTPAASKSILYVDSTTKKMCQIDDGGTVRAGTLSKNQATSQQTGFASDTYLTGSGIQIPSCGMQVGQIYRWLVGIQKTAAGTAAIAVTVRMGSAQTTADTSELVLTQTVAQAATAAGTLMEVIVQVRSVSATGVITGILSLSANAQFGSGVQAASGTFANNAAAGLFLGLSLNGGSLASYTIDTCTGYLLS